MTFRDFQLPEEIERGALGGPRFKTTVLPLDSGFEKRNIDWSVTRGEWDVGYGLLLKFQADPTSVVFDLDTIMNMFYGVQGRADSFRFKDWADFEIALESGTELDPQLIGLGDDSTTVFQVFKRYTTTLASGILTYDRDVIKLLTGATDVFLDGVLQVSGFTIDVNLGTVTFTVPPASTGGTGPSSEEIVAVRCREYHNHVRFDTDKLDVNMEIFNVGSWPNIPIVELRGTG